MRYEPVMARPSVVAYVKSSKQADSVFQAPCHDRAHGASCEMRSAGHLRPSEGRDVALGYFLPLAPRHEASPFNQQRPIAEQGHRPWIVADEKHGVSSRT